MITNITSLTSNGLRDWLIQRVTAVILSLYFIFLMAFIVAHPQLSYASWQSLFSHTAMRIFSFLALLSIVAHSWVGIWTVFTDYIKCAYIRLFLIVLMIIGLLAYLAWGIEILWRI